MTEENKPYRVPSGNWPKLQEAIKKLNKRAAKLGCKPIVLHVLDEITRKVKDKELDYEYEEIIFETTVEGEAPKLEGWTLVAVIEPVGEEKLVREVPGQQCPVEYRTAPLVCDHCGKVRKRSQTFVLRNAEKGHKQVGRKCLADFLGHQNPHNLLAMAEIMFDLDKVAKEAESEGWGSSGGDYVPINKYVAMTVAVTRACGFTPKSKAGEGRPSTASVVWDCCVRPYDKHIRRVIEHFGIAVNESDVQKATEVIEWGRALQGDTSNTYLHDLGVCSRQPIVDWKTAGFVASLVNAFERDKADAEKRSRKVCTSKHVGVVGERQNFRQVLITHVTQFNRAVFTATYVQFLDTDGNILVWYASGTPEWPTIGNKVDIRATVVGHKEWREMKQTQINRVALIEPTDTKEEQHEVSIG